MPITKDMGARVLSVNLVLGVGYEREAKSDEERDERAEFFQKLISVKSDLEEHCLDVIYERLGITAEDVEKAVALAEANRVERQEAERRGRAAKSAKRAGLPEPPPMPVGEPVPPGETPVK